MLEGAVIILYNRIYSNINEDDFTSLEQMNAAIRIHLKEVNTVAMKGRNYSRDQKFIELKKNTLQPLPLLRYEFKRRSVGELATFGFLKREGLLETAKFSVLLTKNCCRALILFFCFSFLFVACNNADIKSKVPNSETAEIIQPQKDKSVIDTNKFQTEKPDSLKETKPDKKVAKLQIKREPQKREGEGVSDPKLNGEPILLQEELSENILANNPDTIKNYLKGVYLGQERNFPRSIADNFEQDISTERIFYPKLYYRVELFENEYSKKPYKILSYSVRKEKKKIIVE